MWAKLTSNMGLKAVSLGIGVILWFIVLGSRNVEITKEVPIEIVIPSSLTVANEVPDKVAFRISGPKAFLRGILNRKEDPIRVNLSSAKAGLFTYRFFSDNIQMPLGVKVLSINPPAMVVKLEHVKTKEVPVRLVTRGSSPEGYKLEKLELTRSTVRLKGPESKMESISEVKTQPVELGSLREIGDKEVRIDIDKLSGVVLEGEPPRIHFEVYQELSTFRIKGLAIQVRSNRSARAIPKEVSIMVSTTTEQMRNLDRDKIKVYVDAQSRRAGTHMLPIKVEMPEAFQLIRVLPAKAKVILK